MIRQHDSMQCGIACLQMICKYFGREYSMNSLSKLCFATTVVVKTQSLLHFLLPQLLCSSKCSRM